MSRETLIRTLISCIISAFSPFLHMGPLGNYVAGMVAGAIIFAPLALPSGARDDRKAAP